MKNDTLPPTYEPSNSRTFGLESSHRSDRPKLGQSGIFRIFHHERYPDQSEYLDLSPIKRYVARCHEVMNVWRYEEWPGNLRMSRATGTVPEWVQSRVHTTEPTGPVPEPFHCDHIARWSARSGTTGRSGTGVNMGARLRSGTVPVPKLWCGHGLTALNVQLHHEATYELVKSKHAVSCIQLVLGR